MQDHKAIEVTNNEEESRFQAVVDGYTSVILYDRDDDVINLIHTEVPVELEGRGIASTMAKFAFDFARTHNLKVIPSCPYIQTYIKRHQEYDDMLVHRH